MKNSNLNYYNMLTQVSRLLAENPEIVLAKPAFIKSVTQLNDKLAAIESLDVKRGDRKTGVAGTKASVKESLIELLMETANFIRAYASQNSKPDLLVKTTVVKSELTQMRELDLIKKAQTVHDLADENLASLGDYGVTMQGIESLVNLKNQFTDLIGTVGTKQVVRAGGTKDLVNLFDEAKEILENQIDGFASAAKKNNLSFFHQYEKARVIFDRGGGHNGNGGDGTPPPPQPV